MSLCPSGGNINAGNPLGIAGPGQKCPQDWPLIQLQQGLVQPIRVEVKDIDGTPLTIDTDVPGTVGVDPYVGDSATPPSVMKIVIEDATGIDSVRMWLKQYAMDNTVLQIEGVYLGAGIFRFNFTGEQTSRPGLFLADIQMLDAEDNVRFLRKAYVSIEQNTLDGLSRNEPLTIAEVRLALRDCPGANELLDDYEFSTSEIISCIRKPIDYFNEALPRVIHYNYNNFPFRYNWLEATVACLLKVIAHYYRKNRLPYSAGGVTIDRFNKSAEYQQLADNMWEKYEAWVRATKVGANIEQGFGSVEGGWSF
mgnify:FL=1